MKSLKGFQGRWNGSLQCIQFSWDSRSLGTDRYIAIVSINGEGSALKVDFNNYMFMDIRSLQGDGNPISFKNTFGGTGVYRIQFCGVSVESKAEVTEENILAFCQKDSECIAQVMMGRADITWTASTSVFENVKSVSLSVRSSCDISNGVLGYQYAFGQNLFVKMPFPGMIRQGAWCDYPPILIPKDCEIEVVPYDSHFSGNLIITKKRSWFK